MKNITTEKGNRVYTTVQGDMWDLIAYKIWGDEYRADELMKANHGWEDVYIFSAGVRLIIPELPERRSAQLPPWKRNR